ncbi:MAG TPA: hypothetical protein VGT78_06205 [Rhizomicrobium sp.]|nr:hypothetical protein [Rhizomicrobium sp.]
MTRRLIILGLGVIGGQVLEQLVFRNPQLEFVVVARNREQLERRVNLSRYVFAQWDLYPKITFEQCDLVDVDRHIELLIRYEPEVVFNATTPFPWWKIERLPSNRRDIAKLAGPGMWCALDGLLPFKISEALHGAQSRATFVNGCYPDAVNRFLSRRPCAPSVGIGNIANVVPGLKLAFAAEYQIHPADVQIRLVCHHYTSLNAPSPTLPNSCPYGLEIQIRERGKLLYFRNEDWPFKLFRDTLPRMRGLAGQSVTVSSASILLDAILNNRSRTLHAPGPNGLVGGYPIKIDKFGKIHLDLPENITETIATQINQEGQRLDGLEIVEPGLMRATSTAASAFREVIGFDLPDITFDNLEEISRCAVRQLNEQYDMDLTDL